MEIAQALAMYQKILDHRKFYVEYATNHGNYENTVRAFDKLLLELDDMLVYGKITMLAKSRLMTEKLLSKTLQWRRDFINGNVLHDLDVELLSGVLTANVAMNLPCLELFPGTGQFLPYVVASEPLYIADRFIEICDDAGKALNNEFYANRRLIKYAINDFDVTQLPYNCFGLVYCFNEFFHADEGYVYAWAREVYNLLYDGGKFIFNFLPYDEFWAIKACYESDFTVLDYKTLCSKLEELGYVIEKCEIHKFRSSFIVATKPGTPPDVIKNGGSMAQIVDI